MQKRLSLPSLPTLLLVFISLVSLSAMADGYEALWQKAQKASKPQQQRALVDKIYLRALREGNGPQLTRTLYAYDALGVTLPEDTIVRNAKRVWTLRRAERNSVEHALLTHILGRLTDNDYLLALSVADTTFLKEQRVRQHLPLVKGYNLFEIFTDYLRQRPMPDSVLVGWQRPVEEDTVVRKHYNFAGEKSEENIGGKENLEDLGNPRNSRDSRDSRDSRTPRDPMSDNPGNPNNPSQSPAVPATPEPKIHKPLAGQYSLYVFNVPGGMSRTCLVETKTGRPIKQWTLHRSDGRGQEDNIPADGNGHVWQRPRQIHNYEGIYSWTLTPLTTEGSTANALRADDFHNGGGWNAGEENKRELQLEILKSDASRGLTSVMIRAPHRNLTLMRDITSGGRLIEQRQYSFSDFIRLDLNWKESYGDEALVTFAYALGGHLYTAQMKILRPKAQ